MISPKPTKRMTILTVNRVPILDEVIDRGNDMPDN
jgi:hypothetical protein